MPMEIEELEMKKLLNQQLVDFVLDYDYVELIFEHGKLIVEIWYDGEPYLYVRVEPQPSANAIRGEESHGQAVRGS